MRTIRFRAWDGRRNKMMFFGLYSLLVDGIERNPEYMEHYKTGMIDFTPMQYTGLKDKNDKDIFEGDICKAVDSSGKIWTAPIEYKEGYFCFESNYSTILNSGYAKELEVIGDIYQHMDLLS